MKKFADIALVVLILIMIAIPVFTMNLDSDATSTIENRNLASPGSVHEGLSVYTKSLTEAIDDRIGFRDNMMQLYNKWAYVVMDAHHNNVIKGDDGWLFYTGDLADYTGTNVDLEKTEKQVAILTAINEWCQERDITFILEIGPNKSSIYHEYMPDYIVQSEKSNVDYAVELLREKGILVCYPKEELLRNKNETELYYRLDTHWNSLGARYLMDELTSQLNLPQHEFDVTESYDPSGDLQNMLGAGFLGEYSLYVNVPMNSQAHVITEDGTQHINLESEGTDKIVCYRDSFHTVLVPYYSYYFNGPLIWQFTIDFDFVEKEKPKYLILGCVERFFDTVVELNASILDTES